jgi:DNA-binding CsgD family transcriptional regulator
MLVDLVCDNAPAIFADLDTATTWNDITNAAGDTYEPLADDKVDGALEAIADFTDMKSPYTLGHSRSVAELGEAAGREFGLGATETKLLRRVGYVHDLGRLGVSNSIWDKRGALSASEQERVRLHPYLTERMLAFCPPLAPLGEIAVQQHERLDGSGYPRGLTGDALTPTGRILAAADAYRGKTEPRPHRTAAKPDEVAVLRAAGHRVTRRREWPAGLTTREVEVLRFVARGYTNKQIAEALVISPKTAGNHVEHIYTKIGVSNRARAGFFAMKHGLMTAADAEDGVNTS